jgi:hypothetical protein
MGHLHSLAPFVPGLHNCSMIRSVLAIFAGVIATVIVVVVVQTMGHAFYPPPPVIHHADSEALKDIIAQLPVGAIAFVLVAWGLGSLAGGLTAATIAGRAQTTHALTVGCIQMAFGIHMLLMIPHPLWFVIASFVIVMSSAWLGARLAQLIRPSPPAGPQPYDMRRKNMAC